MLRLCRRHLFCGTFYTWLTQWSCTGLLSGYYTWCQATSKTHLLFYLLIRRSLLVGHYEEVTELHTKSHKPNEHTPNMRTIPWYNMLELFIWPVSWYLDSCLNLSNQKTHPRPSWRCLLSYWQACRLRFMLRELIFCFCCVRTSHAALEADSHGSSGT